ncbi:MAG: hypothetical protein E7579_00355 [Ruminococcaceae bacterium]|nr:hypothetical protein [Oscillospiraceae bacterium]
MKRFLVRLTASALLFVLLVMSAVLPGTAGDWQKPVGEVLYHQDFSVLSELEKSGIVRGTSSSENSHFTCENDALELNTFDNERVYALLPVTKTGDSYTIEFDFAFSEITSDNGYVGFLLTCRGTEPTNITALIIRADGTIDDFEEPDDALKKAIHGGSEIHVKIPIEKNVLHKIELTAGGTVYTLERENVKVIDDGETGFVVRNASVDVTEIYIVNGVGYTAKSGAYATESYASDEAAASLDASAEQEFLPVSAEEIPAVSPDTGDFMLPYGAVFTAAVMGLLRHWRKRS